MLIVEVNSSSADYYCRPQMARLCRLTGPAYFAISERTPAGGMPVEAGLIAADLFGAAIVREAEPWRMVPASRRAFLLRFAQAAANRLHRLADPRPTADFM